MRSGPLSTLVPLAHVFNVHETAMRMVRCTLTLQLSGRLYFFTSFSFVCRSPVSLSLLLSSPLLSRLLSSYEQPFGTCGAMSGKQGLSQKDTQGIPDTSLTKVLRITLGRCEEGDCYLPGPQTRSAAAISRCSQNLHVSVILPASAPGCLLSWHWREILLSLNNPQNAPVKNKN